MPDDDEGQFTILKRDIWTYFRRNGIDTPIVFRWYDGLRVQLYLGNDLSLCLYVLGAFEPNEFVFLRQRARAGDGRPRWRRERGPVQPLFGPSDRDRADCVLAVEPSRREFARLQANIGVNRLDNVKNVQGCARQPDR